MGLITHERTWQKSRPKVHLTEFEHNLRGITHLRVLTGLVGQSD